MAGNGNLGYTAHFASFIDDNVLDMIQAMRICDGVNLTIPRVGLGVCGETSRKGTGEIVRTNGVQFIGDLVRQGASFNCRKNSTGVSENVSVGGEVAIMDRALPPAFAERFRDGFRTNPAIAVIAVSS